MTYGDLDRKTILENASGKLEVQTDDTIGRTAEGKLTVVGGGGGSGTVTSVNSVLPDTNGNVQLVATDVGALPIIGGTVAGDLVVNSGDTNPFRIQGVDYVYMSGHKSNGTRQWYIGGSNVNQNFQINNEALGTSIDITADSVTFSKDPRSSAVQGTDASSLTRKDYVDSLIGGGGGVTNPMYDEVLYLLTEGLTEPVPPNTASDDVGVYIKNGTYSNLRCYGNSESVGIAMSYQSSYAPFTIIAEQVEATGEIISDVFPILNKSNTFLGSVWVKKHNSSEFSVGVNNADNSDTMYQYINDTGMGIYGSTNGYSFEVVRRDRVSNAFSSTVFVLQTARLLDNIQAVPANQLIEYEEEIQDKIIELEFKLDKANLKGFTKLATKIQSQLDILNSKLEVI